MKKVIKEILDKKLSDIDAQKLNFLLTAEISSVETYNKAIQSIKHTELIPALVNCRDSHAQRILKLRQRLIELGATPAESSGFLGKVSKLVEVGASMWGDQSALAVLAGGEDFDLREYKSSIKCLDEKSRKEVIENILPAQKKTRKTINILCTALRSSESDLKTN